MAELLEEIKKLPRAEQLALAAQIQSWEDDAPIEDEAFLAELKRRAEFAIANPKSGASWQEVKARLLERQDQAQNAE